jgi:hypothetical protein
MPDDAIVSMLIRHMEAHNRNHAEVMERLGGIDGRMDGFDARLSDIQKQTTETNGRLRQAEYQISEIKRTHANWKGRITAISAVGGAVAVLGYDWVKSKLGW